jgi:hypothetical protein
MVDDRNRILDLLAAGKVSVEEAARLLDALGERTGTAGDAGTGAKPAGGRWSWSKSSGGTGAAAAPGMAKFLFVKVNSVKGDNVNIKIPIALLRAGLKLTSLIPPQAADQINKTMAEKGMKFDLNNFKTEDLEELIEAIREMEIDIDAADGDKVHVSAG